ncbi:MAG TPA: response regulator [Blastocatellia bacterium]|jgi:CheY-like chemotaxis protein|nr:response regulator [Blastocatellia bacterium]
MERKSLLVVDDSATFRQLLCMSLTRLEGISQGDITQACDGADALNKMQSKAFDLVLTDVMMPNLNGLELVSRVRSELQSRVPIVIISTKGEEAFVEQGMKNGANCYLLKPISLPRLREVVSGLLAM